MSRKAINIVFIIGSCFYIPGFVMIIWGYVAFIQAVAQQNAQHVAQSGYSGTTTDFTNTLGLFIILLIAGAMMASIGGIAILVARIGAMIEIGKAQEWVWMILLMIFGWIVLLIYLLAGPKPKPAPEKAAYPYPYAVPGQPWQNYQSQAPGMMPPPEQAWAHQYPAELQNMPNKSQD